MRALLPLREKVASGSEPDEGSRGPNIVSASQARPLIRPFGPPSPTRGEGTADRGFPCILCLSPAIAEAFATAAPEAPWTIHAAAEPNDEALIALLRTTFMTPPPDQDDDRWRGPGPLFWLAMAFALACLIAAAVVALRFGVFAHHPRGPQGEATGAPSSRIAPIRARPG